MLAFLLGGFMNIINLKEFEYQNALELEDIIRKQNLHEGEECEFILKKEEDGQTILKLWREIIFKLVALSYHGAKYYPKEDNPFDKLLKVEEDTKILNVHPDTKIIAGDAAKNHKNLEEVNIVSPEIDIYGCAFYDTQNLRKVSFKNTKKCLMGYQAFIFSKVREVEFDPNGFYDCYEHAFNYCHNLIVALPPLGHITGNYIFSDGTKCIFIPKEYEDVAFLSLENYTEIYYEGDASKLLVRYKRHVISDGDYGFNFHRSAGSFDFHESIEPEVYATWAKSYQTYEDFLKRKEELLKTLQ